MLKLVISDDEGKTTVVPLVRDEVTIGRKEGNTIRLTERNVSRRHARISRRESNFVLEDLASYNGIVLNGARLGDARPVKHGDQILIGDYKLQIMEEAGAQPTPAPPAPPPPSEHAAPLLAASVPAPTAASPHGPPGLAALNDPFAPPSTASTTSPPALNGSAIPENLRGLRLVFLAPAGVPAPVTIERLPMVLGRSESADVALAFSSISREHARIFTEDDQLFIEDLGSSNGVQINGEKLKRGVIAPGDMVQLGVVEFRVARRGDSTVVIQRSASEERATARKTPKGLFAAVALGGAAIGVAVFMFATGGTHNASRAVNAATATPSTTTAAPPTPTAVQPQETVVQPNPAASATDAAVAQAQPEAVPAAPEPAAPEPAAPEPAAPGPAAPEPAAPTPTPAAPTAPEPTAQEPVQQTLAASSSRRHRSSTSTRAEHPTAPSRPASPAPTPTPQAHANSVVVQPPHSSSGGGSLASQARASGDPIRFCAHAPVASERERNQCFVDTLRCSNSERECRMLVSAYGSLGRTSDRQRVMRDYVTRYPNGSQVGNYQSQLH